MSSRAATLADAVVTLINAWGSLPAGVTAARVRSVIQLIKDLPAETPATIAVINSSVEDGSNRGDVADDVMLGIVLVANCASNDPADSDTWDALTESLRDHLRTAAAFKNIDLAGIGAQRKAVSTTMVCDADYLNEHEVFVSITEATWFVSVGNRA